MCNYCCGRRRRNLRRSVVHFQTTTPSRKCGRRFFRRRECREFWGRTADGDPYWLFIPKVENSGNTPTQHLLIKYGFELNEGIAKDDGAWDRIWKGNPVNIGIQYSSIGPHVTATTYAIQTNGRFLNEIVAGRASAYFVADISYDDIFGTNHITQFCVSAVPPIRNYGESFDKTVIISIPQCADHNCIDDECKTARPYRKLKR